MNFASRLTRYARKGGLSPFIRRMAIRIVFMTLFCHRFSSDELLKVGDLEEVQCLCINRHGSRYSRDGAVTDTHTIKYDYFRLTVNCYNASVAPHRL